MKLTKPSSVAEFRRRYADSIVFYGAVSTRVVHSQADLGGLGVKGILDEPTDDIVQGGDDHGRLDLGHNIPGEWLDGHDRLDMSRLVFLSAAGRLLDMQHEDCKAMSEEMRSDTNDTMSIFGSICCVM